MILFSRAFIHSWRLIVRVTLQFRELWKVEVHPQAAQPPAVYAPSYWRYVNKARGGDGLKVSYCLRSCWIVHEQYSGPRRHDTLGVARDERATLQCL